MLQKQHTQSTVRLADTLYRLL